MTLSIGDNKVSLYLGNKRVNLSTGNSFCILPDGYTQLAYIQSTGTQYIDTGKVISQTKNYSLQCTFSNFTKLNSSLFGAQQANNRSFISYNGDVYCGNGANRINYSNLINTTSKFTLYCDWNSTTQALSMHVNGGTVTTKTQAGNFANNSLYILNVNGGSGVTPASCKLYNFTIIENDTLILHLIPAIRNSDGKVGLYDIVRKQLFTNTGADNFVIGPVTHSLFTTEGSVQNKYIDAEGSIANSTYSGYNFAYTKYIKVKPNTTYTITGVSRVGALTNHRVSAYTSNKTYINQVSNLVFPQDVIGKRYTTKFTTSADTEYVVINYVYTVDEQIQLVEGDINFGLDVIT